MTYPISAATKVNLDSPTDDPSQARAELVGLIDSFNDLLAISDAEVDARAFSSLAVAVADNSTANKTIVVSSTLNITDNLTIPNTRALRFVKGGMLNIASGKTLNINCCFIAGLYQVFTGSGSVVFGTGSVAAAYTEWFGAKGDATTDDSAAFTATIAAVTSNKIPVYFLSKIYAFASGIKAAYPGVYLKGAWPNFTYGPSAQGTTFKFTAGGTGSIGLTTFVNSGDNQDAAYINIENIAIDGNSLLDYGLYGGFFVNLRNVNIINCNVAGYHIKNGQRSVNEQCSFNGNLDGVLIEDGSIGTTTLTFKECVFRQNTRYGVNVTAASTFIGGVTFESPIFEANASSGINLSGNLTQFSFYGNPWFEANDSALGENGYQIRANITGTSKSIVIEGGVFGSIGLTKIADIVAGSISFNNCNHVGDTTTDQITLGTNAIAILNKSFDNFPMPLGVHTISNVNIVQDTNFPPGYDISTTAITPGTGDFTVSLVFQPYDVNAGVRNLLASVTNGFEMQLGCSARGLYQLNIKQAGIASIHLSTLPFVRLAIPYHIVYTRISGVGYVYQNGIFVDSFADTTNYSTVLKFIGIDQTTTYPSQSDIYKFFILTAGVSQSQVTQMWEVGGSLISGLSNLQLFMEYPVYANNAAAVAAGLLKGQKYQTSIGAMMIVY